jgi:hypothetical protein
MVTMFIKVCPFCNGASYSASDSNEWLCPYCGGNLSLLSSREVGPGWEKKYGAKKINHSAEQDS